MTETHAMLDTVDAHVDALIAELERVKKERDEALKDSARLDWMERKIVNLRVEFSSTTLHGEDRDFVTVSWAKNAPYIRAHGFTLAEAIDNAMSADK